MGSEVDLRRQPAPVIALMAGLVVLGVGALGGGLQFVLDPTGESIGMSAQLLEGSPFTDYLIPGVILFTVLGVYPLVVCYGLYTGRRWAWPAALSVGVALIVWIVVQGTIIGFGHWLQWLYLLFGFVLVLLTLLLRCNL
jgi:hypothetical protein